MDFLIAGGLLSGLSMFLGFLAGAGLRQSVNNKEEGRRELNR